MKVILSLETCHQLSNEISVNVKSQNNFPQFHEKPKFFSNANWLSSRKHLSFAEEVLLKLILNCNRALSISSVKRINKAFHVDASWVIGLRSSPFIETQSWLNLSLRTSGIVFSSLFDCHTFVLHATLVPKIFMSK